MPPRRCIFSPPKDLAPLVGIFSRAHSNQRDRWHQTRSYQRSAEVRSIVCAQRLVSAGDVVDELGIVVKKQRERAFREVDPRVDVPLIRVAKTALPEDCMENLMLESPDILEAVVAPREGNGLSLVVSHTLALGVPERFAGFMVQNAIGDARAVFDPAYQNRARRWGVSPRRAGRRSSIMIRAEKQEDSGNRYETKRLLHRKRPTLCNYNQE